MSTPLSQFRQSLIDHGIVSEETLAAMEAGQTSSETGDARSLAQRLIEHELLTEYQAGVLLDGQPNPLILGNYVVLSKIGQGGMGAVYRARHTRMKRDVAIKVLPTNVLDSEESVRRFQREVEAAARLEHANVVTAYDADEADGVHFLVMQYIEGADLAKLVRKNGPLSVDDALRYLTQAARGLEYAHSQEIVHRDIKPANLILDRLGVVRLLDLGLAKIDQHLLGDRSEPMTEAGAMMGTAQYMAPEQAEDTAKADARSDIYSLGCTLYYLLTARPPYQEDSLVKIILAHRDAPIPSLQEARPDVSPELEAVFQRMVAKDPAQRRQSARELIAELEIVGSNILSADTILVPEANLANSSRATNHRQQAFGYASMILAAALTAIAIGAGLLVFFGAFHFGKPDPTDPPVSQATDETEATDASETENAADYDAIATGVWVRPLDAKAPQPRDGVGYSNGVLTLNDTTLTFSEFYGRDCIIRAKISPTAEAHTLHLRGSIDTNEGDKSGRFYGGWLNQNYFRHGIGYADGYGWVPFAAEIPEKDPFLTDGYLELAFAAIGTKLSMYINGELVAEASDDNLTHGYVRIGVRAGSADFKDIEIMSLDK